MLNDINFYSICEIVFEMNNLQFWDKALDQEASYEANKTWLTNGHTKV